MTHKDGKETNTAPMTAPVPYHEAQAAQTTSDEDAARIELDAPESPNAEAPESAPSARTERHQHLLDAHREFEARLQHILHKPSDHKEKALAAAKQAHDHAHQALDAEK